MRHHDPQKAIRLAHMIAKHLMRGGYADGGDPRFSFSPSPCGAVQFIKGNRDAGLRSTPNERSSKGR